MVIAHHKIITFIGWGLLWSGGISGTVINFTLGVSGKEMFLTVVIPLIVTGAIFLFISTEFVKPMINNKPNSTEVN